MTSYVVICRIGLCPQLGLFEFLPRILKKGKIGIDDILSGALAVVFLAVALSIYSFPDEREDGWDIVAGKTLFDGLIYFVTGVLFFVPNPSDEVRKLKEEVQELKQSMA